MKISLIAAVSADGKIAEFEDQVSLDWTSKEDTKFFTEKTKELGVVVVGRKTYETIGRPLKDRLTIVMTRRPKDFYHIEKPGVLEFTDETPQNIVADLEKREYASLALCGGKSVYSRFLQEGLVNEVYLTIEPLIFGGGVSLAEGFDRIEMNLLDSSKLGDKAVLLHYSIGDYDQD